MLRCIMKKRYFSYFVLITLMFSFNGCKENPQDLSCRLYVYDSPTKVYQISFNGIDSIETICGAMDFDLFVFMKTNHILPKGSKVFKAIHAKKQKQLEKNQADSIVDILKRLNSKIVTDTLEKGVKDVWEYSLFLPNQTISLELVKNKDEDVNALLEMLIDNSPYYVNMEDRIWFDQEYEDYLINKYGKRKLSLSSWD